MSTSLVNRSGSGRALQDRVRSFEPHLRLQKGSERMMAIYLIGPPPFRPYLQLNANRGSRVRQRCQPLGRVSQSDTDREESPLCVALSSAEINMSGWPRR